jgi:CheY-like chemotaxis protein
MKTMKAAPIGAAKTAAPRLSGQRVLVIDDVREICEVMALLLRAEGAHVVTAGSGAEAADRLRGATFDIVLTDLALPDIPGELLVRQALAVSEGRTRVAVVTGCGEPDVSRALAAGAAAVFIKPVDWTTILGFLLAPASLHAA